MQEWKTLINNAKQAYVKQAHQEAIALNKSALSVSKQNFEALFISNEPEQGVATILVTYFNMIDNYIARNEFENADKSFEEAYCFLSSISKKDEPNKQQYEAILQGAKQVNLECMSFLKEHASKLSEDRVKWLSQLPAMLCNLFEKKNRIH